MKKILSMVLMLTMVLMLAACGKSEEDSASAASDKEDASVSVEETEDNAAEEETEKNAAEEETENNAPEETTAQSDEGTAAGELAESSLRDAANTDRQSVYSQNMAFDEAHIYFVSNHELYRCNYDGSEVRKLDMNLENVFAAEGKLWGFFAEYQKPGVVYCLDPETGEAAEVSKMPFSGMIADQIQVSGNWLCYTRDKGNELVIQDLSTGEEKVIFTYEFGSLLSNVDSYCIYGNTLYVLMQDTSSNRNCVLCSYELGSGESYMTQLSGTMNLGTTTSTIWMEEGILLIDRNNGCQFYYAKFSDIDEDKNWNYSEDEGNKIGTDMYADDAIQSVSSWIDSPYNSNFVIGNDLLNIGTSCVEYHKDFDFTDREMIVDGDKRCDGAFGCHGIYDGALYLFLDKDPSAEAEIVKITAGGTVERIPVTIPES